MEIEILEKLTNEAVRTNGSLEEILGKEIKGELFKGYRGRQPIRETETPHREAQKGTLKTPHREAEKGAEGQG